MIPVQILSFSDCHLGNSRLDSSLMCRSLSQLVFPQMHDQIQLVIISGDLFDSAVGFSDRPASDILAFLIEFLCIAHERQITVRILRGTYSHDRIQSDIIPVLHQTYGFTNDLRYFDKVSLEYIERFDMKLLYIPDDVPYTSSDVVMEDVADQMATLGWDTVDYGVIHGYFQHVLPEHAAAKPKLLYRQDQFYFVTRYVLAGHVHEGSISGQVIYNGSSDRLCHGEEGPKGLIRIDDNVTSARVKFIENKNATTFKTLDYSNVEFEQEIVGLLESDIKKLPSDRTIYVRVLHPKADVCVGLQRWVTKAFPHVKFAHKKPATKSTQSVSEEIESILDVELLLPPTPETLPNLILQQLTLQQITSTLTLETIQQYLDRSSA